MLQVVEVGRIYRNKKNRQLYKVVAIGRHTERDEILVYYIALYDAGEWSDCFRPLELFKGKFEKIGAL